jgi:hypothetical protein
MTERKVSACTIGSCAISDLVGPFHRKWRHQTWLRRASPGLNQWYDVIKAFHFLVFFQTPTFEMQRYLFSVYHFPRTFFPYFFKPQRLKCNVFLVHDVIKHFIFPYFFPVLFQDATFEISVSYFSSTWRYKTFHFPIRFQTTTLFNLGFFHIFHIFSLLHLPFFDIVHILSLFDLPFFRIFHIISHFNLLFFHIFHIISQFSSIFSKSFHYSTWVSSIISKSFHYSTHVSSITFISFHYSTCLSSIFSKSVHYSTYFSSIISPYLFTIQLTFLP